MKHLMQYLDSPGAAERGRRMRRAYPIHFYSGRNGAFKSGCMVYDTLPDLDAGTPVLSTVRLVDYRNLRPCDAVDCDDPIGHGMGHFQAHPSYVPFTDWPQLLDWTSGPVLMDEITGVADSNEGSAVPAAVANKLAQLRRADVTVRITGINFIRANKRIREATIAITRCSSSWPKAVKTEDGTERVWKQRRWASMRTYDAQSLPLDDHTEAAYEKADLLVSSHTWIPTNPAIHAYDTYAPVLMVGHVTEHGRCAHCGDNRRVQECQCADYVAKKASSGTRRTAGAKREDRSGSASGLLPVSDTVSLSGLVPSV